MIEIRWHGRGGQGAVTASELLANATLRCDKYVQSFPSFGPERRGAPVLAFTRIDDYPFEIRWQVTEPDIVVVLDTSLLSVINVTAGLKKEGIIVLNTSKDSSEIKKLFPNFKIAKADATSIALKNLGAPITNTSMLGALLKANLIVPFEVISKVVEERFDPRNVASLKETYENTEVLN
jgi:2-oxoacid:acceptor oxidoreductase gamma subunit (pyruvate/2-ketoisovalerate family)